jgi:hypothetical protein
VDRRQMNASSIKSKKCVDYGLYVIDTYIKSGNVYHNNEYTGKVIDKEKGVFYNKNRGGYFAFATENVFRKVPQPDFFPQEKASSSKTLNFGSTWMIGRIYKEVGLDAIMQNLLPNYGDTFQALTSFKLIEPLSAFVNARN